MNELIVNIKEVQKFLMSIESLEIRKRCELFFENEMKEYILTLKKLIERMNEKKEKLDSEIIKELKQLNDNLFKKIEGISLLIEDKRNRKQLREAFRSVVGQWFYLSEYFRKSFDKPRGYPGDFEMMGFIYSCTAVSDDIVGKYFDEYYMDSPYAQAVRNRKDKMVDILSNIFSQHVDTSDFDVFNIACGSCRELRELFEGSFDISSRLNITCFDHDQEALEFSRSELKNVPKETNIKYLKGDILNYVKNVKKTHEEVGDFNFVYSMGLADYLPDNLFKRMIVLAMEILKPGGKFVIAHKIEDKDPFAPYTPKWICEWVFNPRNVDGLLKLIEDSGIENFSIDDHVWDKSNRVIFITLTKG